MAPMDTVMVAVMKPSRNRLSRPLPLFSRNQRPKPSRRRSRSSSSPISPPRAMLTTSISVPRVRRAPFSTTSISSITPPMATNSTHTAMPRIRVCWARLLSRFPPARPMPPPTTMAATLMRVPSPIISYRFFLYPGSVSGIKRKPPKGGLERGTGVEPACRAWEARILPMY